MSIVPRRHPRHAPPRPHHTTTSLHCTPGGTEGLSVSTARQIRRAKGERCQRHWIAMLSECRRRGGGGGHKNNLACAVGCREVSCLRKPAVFLFFFSRCRRVRNLIIITPAPPDRWRSITHEPVDAAPLRQEITAGRRLTLQSGSRLSAPWPPRGTAAIDGVAGWKGTKPIKGGERSSAERERALGERQDETVGEGSRRLF